jgi:hypothetical protein
MSILQAKGVPINCGSTNNPPSWTFSKPNLSSRLEYSSYFRPISPSSSGSIIDKDTNIYRVSSSSGIRDFIFESSSKKIISIKNYSNNVLVNNLQCSGISVGNDILELSFDDGSNQYVNINIQYSPIGSTSNQDTFLSFVNNSLSSHITDQVDLKISGISPTSSQQVYSIQNHANNIYTRNSSFVFKNVDFTCISPWNSYGIANRAGVLISPRHVMFAAHYPIASGSTIRFVTNNNVSITRTITGIITHPNYNSTSKFNDIQVGLLDSDLPNTILFTKILPIDFGKYLPNIKRGIEIPVIIVDQSEYVSVTNLYQLSSIAKCIGQELTSIRRPFFRELYTGDSGSPAFLLINNELVLIFVTTWGIGGSGSFTSLEKDAINQMMSQLGGGYQLTTIDLSSFLSY